MFINNNNNNLNNSMSGLFTFSVTGFICLQSMIEILTVCDRWHIAPCIFVFHKINFAMINNNLSVIIKKTSLIIIYIFYIIFLKSSAY